MIAYRDRPPPRGGVPAFKSVLREGIYMKGTYETHLCSPMRYSTKSEIPLSLVIGWRAEETEED